MKPTTVTTVNPLDAIEDAGRVVVACALALESRDSAFLHTEELSALLYGVYEKVQDVFDELDKQQAKARPQLVTAAGKRVK